MPSLLERIEANAEARLTLPPGCKPRDEIARYRNFLKVESHRLRILHRGGGSGREVCRARAGILDLLLRYILEATQREWASQERVPSEILYCIQYCI